MRVIVLTVGAAIVGVAGTLAAWKRHEERTLSQNEICSDGTKLAGPTEVHGIGYVEPRDEVRRLGFKSSGVVAQNFVKIGDRLFRGQTIMVLDRETLSTEIRTAEAEVALVEARRAALIAGVHSDLIRAAENQVSASSIRRDYWREQLQRYNLLRSKNATAQTEVDETKMRFDSAAAELAAAECQLAELRNRVRPEDRAVADLEVSHAQSRLESLRKRFEDAALVAPFEGIVLEILKREGESVSTDSDGAAVLFADESHLRVRAEIDERYLSELAEGTSVRVFGRNLGKRQFTCALTQIKPVMGNKTVFSHAAAERRDLDVVQVLIDLPESASLPIGLRVDVAIAR